jgi:hypothetical protein
LGRNPPDGSDHTPPLFIGAKMQLPQLVPASLADATFAASQPLQAVASYMSPQAVMNAWMSPALHTPWCATAGTYGPGM